MSKLADPSNALRELGRAATRVKAQIDRDHFAAKIETTNLALYEAARDEIGMRHPELPQDRIDALAEGIVRRMQRDWT